MVHRYKFLLIVLVNVLYQGALQSQFRSTIDSLESVLSKNLDDTTSVKILNQLSEKCEIADIPKYTEPLIVICEKYLKSEKESGLFFNLYLKCLSDAQSNLGYYLKQQGRIGEALDNYEKSLGSKKLLNDKSGMALLLNNIAMIYFNQGSIEQALVSNLESLKIQEQINNKEGIANSLNNIAGIYDNQGDISKALEFYKKSLSIREGIKDQMGIATSLNNIGFIYLGDGDTATAIKYCTRTKRIHETLDDKVGLAYDLNNLGFIFLNQGKIDTAYAYYSASLKIREEIGDKKGMAFSYNNLANIYFKQKKYDKAIELSNKALKLGEGLGFPFIIRDAALSLKNTYYETKQHKEALAMFELYVQMRDSINNLETKKSALKSQFKYEFEKKEAVLKEQQMRERSLAQEKSQKQKLIIWTVVFGMLVVILFLAIVFSQLQKTKKQKILINQQKILVDEKQKEILDSIHYAKRIQFALLASDNMLSAHLPQHFVLFKPKDVVSGDFYWAASTPSGFVYITADCTGHGVPGAFMSLLNISKLSQIVNENKIERPDLILNNVRSEIIKVLNPKGHEQESKDGMDAVLCKLNLKEMKLEYASANNAFYIIRKGEILTCKADKMPVGKGHDDSIPFTHNEIALQKGDTIYTFTDGFADQFGGIKGKKFMYKKLSDLLLSVSSDPLDIQKEKLNASFESWKGDLEQVDDVCLIGVRV
ncbi:tetratricopeptide repeat protein [Aurantibacillus circumpalustris]|uniref:tetratricopeptide repeat protein n=1 Tax=Aurantibacillus circumpalustris TaxID=3036359 RepID=UPI00295B0AFB|nr:tetratricopeptide repeat protein [Aurantibacillus circumpalustris]